MKRKGAKIFDILEWISEYPPTIQIIPFNQKNIKKLLESHNSEKSSEVEKQRNNIYKFIIKNADVLLKFQELTLNYARTLEFEHPSVYPTIVKAAGELNERYYVNARVFWPMPEGKKKELRFYICPYTEGMDIKSEEFTNMMLEKVTRELKTRANEGFFLSIDSKSSDRIKELLDLPTTPQSKLEGKK